MRCRNLTALFLLAATLSLAACATRINRVMADPSRYRDREVTVSGDVVDSLSLGGRGAYRVEDSTGSLWVVTERGVPRRGARVKATGTIRDAFNFSVFGGAVQLPGGLGSGLVMMESEHSTR